MPWDMPRHSLSFDRLRKRGPDTGVSHPTRREGTPGNGGCEKTIDIAPLFSHSRGVLVDLLVIISFGVPTRGTIQGLTLTDSLPVMIPSVTDPHAGTAVMRGTPRPQRAFREQQKDLVDALPPLGSKDPL